MNRLIVILINVLILHVCVVFGYYLPGVSPHTYQEFEPVLLLILPPLLLTLLDLNNTITITTTTSIITITITTTIGKVICIKTNINKDTDAI